VESSVNLPNSGVASMPSMINSHQSQKTNGSVRSRSSRSEGKASQSVEDVEESDSSVENEDSSGVASDLSSDSYYTSGSSDTDGEIDLSVSSVSDEEEGGLTKL
jgi:hypothetical protein